MAFYTYLWLREDGSPYYVGKSFHGNPAYPRGERAYRKGCPSLERIKIQDWPDEATAFAYERYLIDFWGRKDLGTGCLINLTDGGDGMAGLKPDPEMVVRRNKAIGDANRGRKFSPRFSEQCRSRALTRWEDEEYAQHMTEILSAFLKSKGYVDKKAAAMRSPKVRQKLSDAWTPERRAAASKRMRQQNLEKAMTAGV